MTRKLDMTNHYLPTISQDCRKSAMREVETFFTTLSRRHILSIGPGL
ncbi:MAG: hypothetical protein K2I48_09255 [Muribaculaceae bacterium]|nr:hypothetical protein [Muribaculaceae bacterium]